jgi:TetR/AcrR family transcriptional regulator
MKSKPKESAGIASRNPDRTRRRILDAAFKEFSARGLAGGRVDVIAQRARINKRMLYHYFGDKQGLYTAVVHEKIVDRRRIVAAAATPDLDVISNIGLWFRQNCTDADWIKLLAWESLQTSGNQVVAEGERRRLIRQAVARIKDRQKAGLVRGDLPAEFLHLAKVSLTTFPMALPQIARMILGRSPHAPGFQREYEQFLGKIADVFRPAPASKKRGASRRSRR